MNTELLLDSPNWQADGGAARPHDGQPSLLKFVPQPLFLQPMISQPTGRKGKRTNEFEFSFANPMLEASGHPSQPLLG